MAQHNHIADAPRRYTRTDFTALRHRLNRVPVGNIAANVYGGYGEQQLHARGLDTDHQLETWLDAMRDHLVARLSLANPHLAKVLGDARTYNRWPRSAIDYLVQAADKDFTKPTPADSITAWLKPVATRPLQLEGIQTLEGLVDYINARGAGWYRGVTRIGAGKARAIEHWLQGHTEQLGALQLDDGPARTDLVDVAPGAAVVLVPLERIRSLQLDGRQGLNRAQSFCLISARTDLEAVQAYLYKFRQRPMTERAYQKELERFLLWCVLVAKKPMSTVGTDECEAYKDFLAAVPADWIGRKALRSSDGWRPFSGQLQPSSQRYAIQILRTFFSWLTDVRYLGGNPWHTVDDPVVESKELAIDIDQALPERLWTALAREGGILDQVCAARPSPRDGHDTSPMRAWTPGVDAVQFRAARAAVLLIGYSGMRREEVARVSRDRCHPVSETAGQASVLWEIAVLGKRRKWRTVFVPERVIDALRAHWQDRGLNFDSELISTQPLLSPVVIAATPAANVKHVAMNDDCTERLVGAGFMPGAIYDLVVSALKRVATDESLGLEVSERELLKKAPHALRHTFATGLVGKNVPLDVVQRLLGHASLQTTSIYVRAERTRSIQELAKLYGS